jgi:hypothetical protein
MEAPATLPVVLCPGCGEPMDPKGVVPEASVARAANYPPLQSNWPTTS